MTKSTCPICAKTFTFKEILQLADKKLDSALCRKHLIKLDIALQRETVNDD